MRLIFAGTPEFARVALEQLHAAGHEIALVLCQPDRPAGRGLKLQASSVKQLALEQGWALAQPRSLRLDGKYPEDAQAARTLMAAAQADAMVVAAYGLILPQWVLDLMSAAAPGRPKQGAAPSGGSEDTPVPNVGASFAAGPPQGETAPSGGSEDTPVPNVGASFAAGPPQGETAPSGGSEDTPVPNVGACKFGCFNIHASLLPRWRGAAPIHRAIEAGDAQTGVTIMQMDAGLDTGAMLRVATLPIGATDTTATLHDSLAALGARLMVETLALAALGRLQPVAQAAEGVSYAHKIEKHEAVVDWAQAADLIVRRVRAFNPFPGASSELNGETLKIWRASIAPGTPPAGTVPGTILAASADGIAVAAAESIVTLTELQRPGARRLGVADFLRGFELRPGMVFIERG